MRPIAGGLKEQVGFLKQRPALIRKRLGNMARTNIYRKDNRPLLGNRASVNIKRRLSIPGSKKASTSSGPSQAFTKKNTFNTSGNGGVKVYEGKTFPNRTFVNQKFANQRSAGGQRGVGQRVNRGGFKLKGGVRGGARGNMRGGARGGMRGSRNTSLNKTGNQPLKIKTKDNLDKDLDSYMAKSKSYLDNDIDVYMAQNH